MIYFCLGQLMINLCWVLYLMAINFHREATEAFSLFVFLAILSTGREMTLREKLPTETTDAIERRLMSRWWIFGAGACESITWIVIVCSIMWLVSGLPQTAWDFTGGVMVIALGFAFSLLGRDRALGYLARKRFRRFSRASQELPGLGTGLKP